MKLEDGLLEVVKVVEHEDGGATYTFDMTDEMSDICGSLGLKLLLYCGALDRSPASVFDMLGEMLTEKQGDTQGPPQTIWVDFNESGSVVSGGAGPARYDGEYTYVLKPQTK